MKENNFNVVQSAVRIIGLIFTKWYKEFNLTEYLSMVIEKCKEKNKNLNDELVKVLEIMSTYRIDEGLIETIKSMMNNKAPAIR